MTLKPLILLPFLATPVFAGSMTAPSPEPAPTVPVTPAPAQLGGDWTGASTGLQLGYGYADPDGAEDEPSDGAVYGLRAFYDHDFGNWVAGGGVEYDGTNIDLGDAGDLDALAEMLARHAGAASDGRVVACFSATSNVTGIRTDVGAVAECLKRGRALAVFDWATAAAHYPPRLHFNGGVSADALVFSGHKLPGGVGAKPMNYRVRARRAVHAARRAGKLQADEWTHDESVTTQAIVNAVRAAVIEGGA